MTESVCRVEPWRLDGRVLAMAFTTSKGAFTERIEFPIEIPRSASVDRIIDLLAIVSSVSYAKASGPGSIDAANRSLTPSAAEFVSSLFDDGMREFAHHNGFPLHGTFTLTGHSPCDPSVAPSITSRRQILIPIGGGRDSAVVATALAGLQPALMSVGDNPHSARIAERLGLPMHVVTRTIDPALIALNGRGAPNGHVPVTAINSLIALVLAEALGMGAVVMANEASSSAPTRIVEGTSINHQFSKSLRCETLLRDALADSGIDIEYFSALRNRRDHEISRVFIRKCEPLHTAFMSCNRAMVRDPERRSDGWCGTCPKCRSVFLSLAPWSTPPHMTRIFGSDLLDDPRQTAGFAELLDAGEKPFECVGDVLEARRAMAALAGDPSWASHAVVTDVSVAPQDTPGPVESRLDQTHHMPTDVDVVMRAFFS